MEARLKSGVSADWERVILVCGKCTKRLGGGFGPKGKTPLAKALRKFLGLSRWRKSPIGVVETRCLGVCPRGAVTVIDGTDSRAWLLVRAGSDIAEVAAKIGI